MHAGDGAQLTVEECTCSRIAEGSLDVYGAGTSLQVLNCKFKDCCTAQSPVATGHGTLGSAVRLPKNGHSTSGRSSKSAPPEATSAGRCVCHPRAPS